MCVLIGEDEPIVLLTTATWLEDAGFKVMTARDGLHAVDLLEQHPGYFTALVTDFHMPRGMTRAHVVMYTPDIPDDPDDHHDSDRLCRHGGLATAVRRGRAGEAVSSGRVGFAFKDGPARLSCKEISRA